MALRNNYTPQQIQQAYPPITLQTSLSCVKDISLLYYHNETPTLKNIEQAYGFEFASRVIVKSHLLLVNAFVGVSNKLDGFQIDTLSDQIVTEYSELNLLEIAHFCSRLRSGKYEKFFGSVDAMMILKSLGMYLRDRNDDINTAYLKSESVKRQKENEEMKSNCMTYDEYRKTLSEEEARDSIFEKIYRKSKAREMVSKS